MTLRSSSILSCLATTGYTPIRSVPDILTFASNVCRCNHRRREVSLRWVDPQRQGYPDGRTLRPCESRELQTVRTLHPFHTL